MATKLILGSHAVKALMLQAKRFGAMSVYLAKSADLAQSQAEDIATWTSKLIDAMTRIQRETQCAAAATRGVAQDKIRTLKTQADSTKRKMLDTSELNSSRTIKANFRLIFGPPRDVEYKSNSTKSVMTTNLIRISTIRDLCETHPQGVIALATTYPTKTWTESSPEVFDGIIKLVKDETEQDWPEEIVDIMDELETERPMSDAFRNLRAKISQQRDRRRRRIHDSGDTTRVVEALATQTLFDQYTSGMTQLPSLQQMALVPSSFNHSQTQGYNSTFVEKSRQQPLPSKNPAVDDSLPPSEENREMKDMYTNAPASNISKMPEPFRTAIENSRLWKWERSHKLKTTGCWPSLFPKDQKQDVSFTIWCGNKGGEHLTKFFGGQLEMSS